MRVIYRKIRHARYLYIKRSVEKVWGARYLSKNTVLPILQNDFPCLRVYHVLIMCFIHIRGSKIFCIAELP